MHILSAESGTTRICTVSGLPILSKPDWTAVAIESDYRANISVIGNHIIFSRPDGYIRLQGVKQSLDLIDRVIAETVPADQPYILIEDFSNLQGAAFDARGFFINNLRQRGRLAGLIFCKPSSLLKISIKLGKRLYRDDREIRLANDYTQAVRFALEISSDYDIASGRAAAKTADLTGGEQGRAAAHDVISNDDWFLNLDGFSTKMKVIDQKILYSISTGLLKEEHVEPISELREKLQKSIMPEGTIEYVIADVTNLKGGNRKARKHYMDSLKKWHRAHPLKMFIFFGTNRFVQAASNLARPFMPFKIRVAHNLADALRIVARDQIDGEKKYSATEPANAAATVDVDDQIRHYVDELQQFLGMIDWERDGSDELWQSDASHPFANVYESIALIKGELDELIGDKDRAEEALRRANDELETRVKNRTLELENANEELRAEICERQKVQVELASAKQLAESASKAKSDFMANMSHELRTPLNHIIGFTELILDKKFGELNVTQEDYLKDVESSSKHLLSLINDILDLSKIEAGKIEIESSEVNLPILLENSLAMFKTKAMEHSIQLSLDIKEVPDNIRVDERKLKQILYNLLSNAVKFTPDGGDVRIAARRCEYYDEQNSAAAGHPDDGIRISVIDTGIGVDTENFDRIFRAFEQADGSVSRRFEGTGLGLSLTRRLVELQGGRIWVESDGKGKGTSFRFILPV